MQLTKKQLVQETRVLIQFAITVAIFFAGVMALVLQDKNTAAFWGITVAFYVVDYLTIEWIGERIRSSWFKWLKASLYVGIALYVPLIIVASVYANKPFPMQYFWVMVTLFISSLAMPVISWLMIMLHLDWLAVKDIYRMVIGWQRRTTVRKLAKNP